MKRKKINEMHPWEFEEVAVDMLDEFLQSMIERDDLARAPTKKEIENSSEDISCIFKSKGMKLYKRYKRRLEELGSHIFYQKFSIDARGLLDVN